MIADVPQFETKRRPAQELPVVRGIFKMRVTAVGLGGDDEVVSAVRADPDYSGGGGGTAGTREYAVVRASEKVVDDVIIVFVLEGGTHKLYNGKRIYMMEMGGGGELPDLQYQGMGLFEIAQHVLGGDFARGVPPVI